MIGYRTIDTENEVLRYRNKEQKILIYDVYKYLIGETDNKEELIQRIKEMKKK